MSVIDWAHNNRYIQKYLRIQTEQKRKDLNCVRKSYYSSKRIMYDFKLSNSKLFCPLIGRTSCYTIEIVSFDNKPPGTSHNIIFCFVPKFTIQDPNYIYIR